MLIQSSIRLPRNTTRVALLLLAVAVLYWPDTVALGRYWHGQDTNAQTGVVIALFCGWLLFRARARFERIPMAPAPWACLPLIACAAVSLIGWRAGILTVQLCFLPLIFWLALLSMLGWQAARLAGFAIGYLYFSLPGWKLLAPALQRLTAWAAGIIGPVLGVPVTVAGTTASLPGGITFTVAPPCSGVDFLTIGLAIAFLYGELERARLRRRAGLIAGMVLLAIVSNWLRVILILAIAYISQMRSPLATRDHVALGWVVFACALLFYVWLAGRTGRLAPDAAQFDGAVTAIHASGYKAGRAWRFGGVAIAWLLVPGLVYGSLWMTRTGVHASTPELPSGHSAWHGPAVASDPLWQPKFVGAQIERRALYRDHEGRAVEVLAIGFAEQSDGARILNERNSLLGDRGLAVEKVALLRNGGIPHSEVIALDSRGQRSVIWSVIDIDGRLFGEPLFSQLWYGARSLLGAPYSALFALRAQCDRSCDGARAALADFLRANGPALFASLPDAGLQG